MELRVRDEQAVLVGVADATPESAEGQAPREVDPRALPLGGELAEALHEWARVAAAVRRTTEQAAEQTAGEPGPDGEPEAAAMVSQRGRQLAGRLATVMGRPVRYRDPLTEDELVVPPAERPVRVSALRRLIGGRDVPEPTPWATGLTVSAFAAVVVLVAIMSLATTLATETTGWLAIAAAVVVTGGLAPSLWLGRRVPIVRWIVLGAAVGIAFSWLGVLSLLSR